MQRMPGVVAVLTGAAIAAGMTPWSAVRAAADVQTALERQADALEAAADAVDVDAAAPAASAGEVAIACDLAPRFHDDSRKGGAGARDRFRALRWKALPKTARCAGREIVFQPEGFGAFVTDIAEAEGGRYRALRGGWQAAPLAGAGSECLYEKRDGQWQLVMCVGTWVS